MDIKIPESEKYEHFVVLNKYLKINLLFFIIQIKK